MNRLCGSEWVIKFLVTAVVFYMSGCMSLNKTCKNSETLPADRIEACGQALEASASAESSAFLLLKRAESYRLLANTTPAHSSLAKNNESSTFTFTPHVTNSVETMEDSETNMYLKALHDLDKAELLVPDSNLELRTDILLERAEIKRLVDRATEAFQDIRKASVLSPKDADPVIQLALLNLDLGDVKQGISQLTKAVEMAPENSTARYYLMRHSQIQGLTQECLDQGEHALEVDPENTLILAVRARCLASSGNVAKATSDLQTIQTIKPSRAIVFQDMAMAYLALEKPKDAAVAAERAVLSDPSMPDAYFEWITALSAMNEHEKAIEAYQIFMNTEIEDRIGIANNLAWELYLAGQYEKAFSVLSAWLEKYPEPIDEVHHIANREGYPLVLDTLAHILSASGRSHEAVTTFLRANKIGGNAFNKKYRMYLSNLGFSPNSEQDQFVRAVSECVKTKEKCKLYTE